MSIRSSTASRLLVCLVALVVCGAGTVGVVAATGGSALLETEDDPLEDSVDETDDLENATNDTDGDIEESVDETDDLVNTTDGVDETESETTDTADDLENTNDESTDELEDAVDETTDEIDGTVDDGVDETSDEFDDGVDETTDAVDETVDGTTENLENGTETATDELEDAVDETTDAVDASDDGIESTVTGSLDLEVSTGASSASGDGADDSESAGAGGSSDGSDGNGGSDGASPVPDGASSASDAVLVGLLGAITATGAAAGGASAAGGAAGAGASASAGAGAGSAAGSAGAAGTGGAAGGGATGLTPSWLSQSALLRHLRRLGSLLPLELVSILGYSRYDDSDPLENDRRRAIYETIAADPGCYLSRVSEESGVALSTVRHHVRVLEEEGLVSATKVNGKRRYYLADEAEPAAGEDGPTLEDVELHAALAEPAKRAVLEALAELDAAPNGRLAEELDRDPSTVSHHLSALEDDGLVVREKEGRSVVNELAPDVEAALRAADAPLEDESTEPSASAPADD